MAQGTLYLIPTFLSDDSPITLLPTYNITVINSLEHFVVERAKTARAFLKKTGYTRPLQNALMEELNEHTPARDYAPLLKPLLEGKDVGLLSEAGMPCLADPGAQLVSLAHQRQIKVKPLTGPSSIILGLVASGLNGQNFAFNGYLPVDKGQRISNIRQLEKKSSTLKQTQGFIETPYRNNQLLSDLLQNLAPATLLCIAVGISSDNESIQTHTVAQWKTKVPDLHKIPAIFFLQA